MPPGRRHKGAEAGGTFSPDRRSSRFGGSLEMSGQESKPVSAPPSLDVFRKADQRALDGIPTGFCVCRADGGLIRYNRRATELWGRTPPLDDPGAREGAAFRRYGADGAPLSFDSTPVAAVLRTGESVFGAELVIERADRSRMPVLMNAAPLRDPSGRVEGAVCSFQELTERKRTEEALRASEAELQSVINRTPFMLVRCTRDLRYRFISDAYAQMIGMQRDEILGKTIAEMLGDQGFGTLRPYIEQVLRGEEVQFEYELDFPDVGRRCLSIVYRPERDTNGDIGGWIASILDITEERQGDAARRLLASIVESSDDPIISKDLNGTILRWNPGACRPFGHSAEEVIGKPITIIIPEELHGQEPVILDRIRHGERIEHFETVRRC